MYRTFEATFFSHQVLFAERGDINGLMSQYHEHATLILFDTIIVGHECIRLFLSNHIDYLNQSSLDSIEKYTETNNIISIQAVITSHLGKQCISYILILLDGKLLYQIITFTEQMQHVATHHDLCKV